MQNGFSPVAEIISKLYDCQPILVQLQSIIFIVMFIPSNFVVIQILKQRGLRVTLIIGAVIMIAGAWLRQVLSAYQEFWIVCFGSAVAAFGQVCFLNSTSKIASVWFGTKERALATALGSLSTPLGAIIGFILPSLLISEKDEADIPRGQ